MMKRHVGWSASAAVLALAAALAGCGGSGGGDSPEGAANGSEPNRTPASTETPKIYIYQNFSGMNPQMPEGSDPERLTEMTRLVVEKTGIEPVAIVPPKGSEAQKLNLMLGSSDNLDVFVGDWTVYGPQGAIQPLNELLDQYGPNIKKAWPAEHWTALTDKQGKIWAIPQATAGAPYPIWVRTDWLAKFNLPMPKTIEELENVMQVFKEQDPDGNGKDDTIVLTTTLELRNSFVGAFTDHGYSNWLDPTDNRIKIAEVQPGYKDFMEKMADWYKKGYIHKEAFGKHEPLELLKTGRVGVAARWYSNITLNLPKVQEIMPEVQYDVAKQLSGPKGNPQTLRPAPRSGFLIPQKSKNAAAVVRYMDWHYQSLENALLVHYGLEGTDWRYVDKNAKPQAILELLQAPKPYAGEMSMANTRMLNKQYRFEDKTRGFHEYFLNNYYLDLGNGRMPMDADINYDAKRLGEAAPGINDINRLRDEEFVKFVMGARPMSDWDKFIDQLNKAGLDKLHEALTVQYREQAK